MKTHLTALALSLALAAIMSTSATAQPRDSRLQDCIDNSAAGQTTSDDAVIANCDQLTKKRLVIAGGQTLEDGEEIFLESEGVQWAAGVLDGRPAVIGNHNAPSKDDARFTLRIVDEGKRIIRLSRGNTYVSRFSYWSAFPAHRLSIYLLVPGNPNGYGDFTVADVGNGLVTLKESGAWISRFCCVPGTSITNAIVASFHGQADKGTHIRMTRVPVPKIEAWATRVRHIRIEGLVVNKRSEASDDEVYLIVERPDKTKVRIPAVTKIPNGTEAALPFQTTRPKTIMADAYYAIVMNESDASKKSWSVCEDFTTNSALNVSLYEKDNELTDEDNSGIHKPDLLGTARIDTWSEEGRQTKTLTGDGGNYSLVYSVERNQTDLPVCVKPTVIRDASVLRSQASACETKCNNATGGAVGSCSLNVSRDCSQLAVTLLGCIAVCSAAGGNK